MDNPFGGASGPSGWSFGQPPASNIPPRTTSTTLASACVEGTPTPVQNVFGTQQQLVQSPFLQPPQAPALFSFGNPLQSTGSSFATPTQPSTPCRFNTPLVTMGTGAVGANQVRPTFTVPSLNPSMFGNTPVPVTPGTPVRFQAIDGSKAINKRGISQKTRTRKQYVTAMKEYEKKPYEERRCQNYLANGNGPQGMGFGMGQGNPALSTSSSIFSLSPFNNTASVAPAPASTPILPTFNLTTNTAPTTTPSLFSNPTATPATGSLFNNTYKPTVTWPPSTTAPAKPLFSSPLAPSTTIATATSFGFNTAPTTTRSATTFPTFSFPNNNNHNQMQTGNSNAPQSVFPVAPPAFQSPVNRTTLIQIQEGPGTQTQTFSFSAAPNTTISICTTGSIEITSPQQAVDNTWPVLSPPNVTSFFGQPGNLNGQGSSVQYSLPQANGGSTQVEVFGGGPMTRIVVSPAPQRQQASAAGSSPFVMSQPMNSPQSFKQIREEKPAPGNSNGSTHATLGLGVPASSSAKNASSTASPQKRTASEMEGSLPDVDISSLNKSPKIESAEEVEQVAAASKTSDDDAKSKPEKEGTEENESGDNNRQIGMTFGEAPSGASDDTETG